MNALAQCRLPIAEVHGAEMPEVCPCCSGEGFLFWENSTSAGRCHECRGTGELFRASPLAPLTRPSNG